jgi:hypothetical protein
MRPVFVEVESAHAGDENATALHAVRGTLTVA